MQLARTFLAGRPVLAKILGNAGWLVFDRLMRMGVGVVVSVWIARTLGPSDFGALNWMLAMGGLFFATTGMGLNEILVRELVRDPDAADELLGTGFAMQVAGGLAGMMTMIGVVLVLRPGDGDALMLALAVAPTLVVQSSDVVRYFYEARFESRYTVWVANGAFLIVTLARVAMLLAGAPMIAFAILTTAEMAMAAVGMFAIYVSQGARQGWALRRWRVRWQRAKTLFQASWPLMLSGAAVLINMKIDQVMLGEMTDDAAVGIFTAAVRISELWYFLPLVIMASAFPAVVAVHGKDPVAEALQWRRMYALLLWLGIAAGIVATLLSDWGVTLLYGDDYAGAGPVLAAHIWGGVSVCIGLVWSKWMLLEGRQVLILYNQLLGAALNVGFNLWLIPLMGVMGAAIATLLSYSVSMLTGMLSHRPGETFGHLWVALRPWTLIPGRAGA